MSDQELINLSNKLDLTPERITQLLEQMDSIKVRYEPLRLDLGCEDFKETFNKTIDLIIKFFKNILKDVIDGSGINATTIDLLKNRREQLEDRTRMESNKSRSNTFTVKTRIRNLSTRYRPVTEINALSQNLTNLFAVSERYYNYMNQTLLPIVVNFTDENSLTTILDKVQPFEHFDDGPLFSNKGHGLESLQLLGNRKLFITHLESDDPIQKLTSQTITLVHAEIEPQEVPVSIEFHRFSRTGQLSILRRLESLLNMMDTNCSLNVVHRRRARIESIIRTVEQLSRNTGVEPDESKQTLMSLMKLYNSWLNDNYIEYTRLLCRNVTAILNVCELNLE